VGLRSRAGKLEDTYQPRLWILLTVLVLVLAYVIYFVAANDEQVSVQLLFAEVDTSLIWVILLALALGMVAGLLMSQLYRRRRSASSATPSSIRPGDSKLKASRADPPPSSPPT
jgi:uncharacterized integral membrane protein